jgi:PAS domain S-box-containing protein
MENSHQHSPDSSTVQKWFRNPNISLFFAFLVFILAGFFWWRVSVSYQKYLMDQSRTRVQIRVDGIASSLASAINRRQALLTGLSAFIKLYAKDKNLNDQFNLYASGLYANDPVIRAIEFFPVDGYELIYPTAQNETLKGRTIEDLINDTRPDVRADVQRAIQSRVITLSNPYELLQGGKGVVARMAVYDGNEFLGLTVVVLNLEPLLEVPGLNPAPADLRTALKDSKGQLFYGVDQVFFESPATVQIQLPEGYWTLAGVPLNGWQSQNLVQTNIFWLAGILLALMFSGMALFISRRQITLSRKIEVQGFKLGESEERFQRLFDTSLDAILITAPDGEVFAANPSACRIFGRTEDEIRKLGRNATSNLADPRLPAALEKRLRIGYFFGELTFVRKNGEIFPGEISSALYKDSQGRDRTSMIIRDISERKRVEEQIQITQDKLQNLLKEADINRKVLLSMVEDRKSVV